MPTHLAQHRGCRSTGRLLSWIAIGAVAAAPATAPAQVVYSSAGAVPADILAAVDAFRADLGPLNPNVPGSFGSGRREINWDAVPPGEAAPNPFPGGFFNGTTPGRARGVVFGTPGTGFQVSANAGDGPVKFGNIDPSYPATFDAFSPQRLFTAIGSNVVDVDFFVPGTTTAALTRGFGAVFTDVDLPGTTSIQYFGRGGTLLGTFFAPPATGNETFSFLGVSFATPLVSRVRITSGNAALAANVHDVAGTDVVAMDDFIFGEPIAAVPEPATWPLTVTGLGMLGLAARHRRSRR